MSDQQAEGRVNQSIQAFSFGDPAPAWVVGRYSIIWSAG